MDVGFRDWGLIKRRWEAWWGCGYLDRPVLQVYAPKRAPDRLDPIKVGRLDERGTDPEVRHADADHIIESAKRRLAETYLGGEALAHCNPGWSVGHAAFCGCGVRFRDETVWAEPLAGGGEDRYPEYSHDPENRWWRWFCEFQKEAARRGEGRYMLLPHLGNPTFDTLAQIRGSTRLMIDIARDRQLVKAQMGRLGEIMRGIYGSQMRAVGEDPSVEGYLNAYGAWSPGTSLGLEADEAVSISPGDFMDIVMPDTMAIMGTVEYNMYHVDGVNYVKHLDALLGVPEIRAIQWIPGAGHMGLRQWIPLIRRIQAKRKPVLIYSQAADCVSEVLEAIGGLRPEGLAICVHAGSEDDAERLIGKVESLFR
ncbi:MAG: hypothetical protein FWE70_08135 [Oscillospiraceae bacterium]|nr:hypothetical protein [Oscillospiraceae bacterium]